MYSLKRTFVFLVSASYPKKKTLHNLNDCLKTQKQKTQTNHKFKPLLFDVVFGRVWKTCLLNCVEFKVKHGHVMRIKALQILFETVPWSSLI